MAHHMYHSPTYTRRIMFPPIDSVQHNGDLRSTNADGSIVKFSTEAYTILDPVNKNIRSVRVNVFDILNVNGFSRLIPLDIEYWGADAGTGESKMLADLYGFKCDPTDDIVERIPAEFDSNGTFVGFSVIGYSYVMLAPKANWRNSVSFAPSRIRPLSYWITCETE